MRSINSLDFSPQCVNFTLASHINLQNCLTEMSFLRQCSVQTWRQREKVKSKWGQQPKRWETKIQGKETRAKRRGNRGGKTRGTVSEKKGKKDPRKGDRREEDRVVFYHPRGSSFPQIRDRKQAATGNCFARASPKGLMARNQHKKIIKKLLWMAEPLSLFICVIAGVRK